MKGEGGRKEERAEVGRREEVVEGDKECGQRSGEGNGGGGVTREDVSRVSRGRG